MASLSNINGIFDVHSTGAIQFNGNHGTAGQILKSNGNAAPTWIPQSDIVGAYLPLAGGTLTGATATASGISFTVGGVFTLQGSGNNTTTFDTTANQLIIKNSAYSTASGLALRSSNNTWQMQLYASGGNNYGFLASEWGAWDFKKTIGGGLYLNNNTTYFVQPESTSNMNAATFAGNVTVNGNIIGATGNTTEVGTYSTGAIKRIRMCQGGEIHFGDTTTSNALGITEGAWDNFSDQDRIGLYCRNELKVYGNSNVLRLTIPTNGTSVFAGDVQTTGMYIGSVNNSYDFYNNGTTYLNGATTIDATLTLPGTTAQYVRGDGSLATFPTVGNGTVTSVATGSGLTGGTITTSGTLSLDRPNSALGAVLAQYGTTGSGARIRCTAPFNTNSSKMFSIEITIYSSYVQHNYVVSAYMYSTTNQWYDPKAIYTTTGNSTPDIYVGRDANGKAYISIANGSYTGVLVHNMTQGYVTSVNDTYDPWTITLDNGNENSVSVSTSQVWTTANHTPGNYLPLAGGTMTGAINMNSNAITSGGDIYSNSWFRNNNSGQGFYNQATGNHFYSDGGYWNVGYSGTNGIRLRNGHAGTVMGYLYGETSGQFGLLDKNGNWTVRTDGATVTEIRCNNVTGFQMNASGQITLSSTLTTAALVKINNEISISTYNDRNLKIQGASSSDAGITGYAGTGGHLWQLYGSGNDYGFLNGNWAAWDLKKTKNGSLYMNNNNTYYLDTSSTSNLNAITTAGAIQANGSINLKNQITLPASGLSNLSSGSRPAYAIYQEGGAWTHPYPDLCLAMHTGIKLGANASYNGIRFYDDYTMATQVMAVNDSSSPIGSGHVYVNNVLQAGASLRAPIFYDSNNTTYYTRPSTSSLINSLYTHGLIQAGQSGSGDIYIGGTSSNYFRFHTNNADSYFDMNCGNIYWRQGASTRYYFYTTTANMTINGSLTQNSDERVKENIVEISDCIDKVKAIRGVYYNRTDFNTEVKKVGLIAQEVEKVLPEVILEAPDTGLKSVAYAELTSILVNAIKEQQDIIDDLKVRIENLEK